jgi:hypothetical protein
MGHPNFSRSGVLKVGVAAQGWLKGRLHPRTGEPLRILRPRLPPGSMASILTYGVRAQAAVPRRQNDASHWRRALAHRCSMRTH